MAQVVDVSVAIAWCVETQATPLTEASLEAAVAAGGHVPSVFWFEILNALVRLEGRGIVQHGQVEGFIEQIAEFSLVVDAAPSAHAMIELYRLSRMYALSVYDAAYLELALRTGLPLATRDEPLAKAAARAGATLFSA